MAEAVFGWGRQTVALGLAESRTGIIFWGLKRLSVAANAGKSNSAGRAQRFVSSPMPMRNKTRRFAPV